MADNDKQLPPIPPLPEEFQIPYQAIDSWTSIPTHQYVLAKLTRGDLDNFFFAIDKTIQAQGWFQETMVHYTNGRLEESNKSLQESRRALYEARNKLRQFFTAIMISASKGENG